jgi:hypothetical protein
LIFLGTRLIPLSLIEERGNFLMKEGAESPLLNSLLLVIL